MPCITDVELESILHPTYLARGITPVYMKDNRNRLSFQLCENEDSPVKCVDLDERFDPYVKLCFIVLDPVVHSPVVETLARLDSDVRYNAFDCGIIKEEYEYDNYFVDDNELYFDIILPHHPTRKPTVIFRMTIGDSITSGDHSHITEGAFLVPHVYAYHELSLDEDVAPRGGGLRLHLEADAILVIPRAVKRWMSLRRFVTMRRCALFWLLCHANASEERRIKRARMGMVDDPLE